MVSTMGPVTETSIVERNVFVNFIDLVFPGTRHKAEFYYIYLCAFGRFNNRFLVFSVPLQRQC